ncbi:MAG: protein kinase, partial [Acidobacteriota bacterium]
MSLTRIDETWLRTVAHEALQQPPTARRRTIENHCRDPEVSSAIERTLSGYVEADLETGGALAGPLWNDLLAALGGAEASSDDAADGDLPGGGEQTPLTGARFGRLGRLRVERLLGSGGMGRVYEAYDELLDRRVALKVLRGGDRLAPTARARFLREAQLSSRLDHPHVCRLYDLVEDDGVEALVLELIEGQSLAGTLLDAPPPRAEALRIASEMAAGLAAAHAAGVVHRDLKPANVMLTANGGVKIVDFGIARGERSAPPESDKTDSGGEHPGAPFKTRHGTTLGTLSYMSPEQARGESVGPASDIFSFGLVLREMLTGTKAYPAEPAPELWSRVTGRRLEPYDQIDTGVRGLLDRMLDAEPASRPEAGELVEELDRLTAADDRRGGVPAALALAAIVAAAAFFIVRTPADKPIFTAGETPRVAVLPIQNLSDDPGLGWVRSGLAEMVIESLASVPELDVIAAADIRELAERRNDDLTVDAAAEGLGANLVLAASLERTDDGAYRLTYRTERPGFAAQTRHATGADLFAAAAEMAAATTRRLAPGALLPDLRETFSTDPFVNRLYATALAALNDERGDRAEPFLRGVLEIDEDAVEARLRLAEALNFQSRWQEATAILTSLVEGNRHRPAILASAFINLSNSAFGRDDQEAAANWAEKALEVTLAADDRRGTAAAHYALARVLRFPDPVRASKHLEEAEPLQRETGNRLGEAKVIQLQGILLDEAGDLTGASEKFTAALEIAREIEA